VYRYVHGTVDLRLTGKC